MTSPPGHTRLRRDLGLRDVFAISTGAMFSSGFFLLPGIAFSQAGSWMVLAYALSALLVVPAMWSQAELASALPRAGGTYYYLDRSMGPLVGTVGGLGTWIAMGLKNTFALIGIGAYLSLFVDVDITSVALALAGVFTAINVWGTKETARLQRWLVWALLSILALFLIAGFGWVAVQDPSSAASRGLQGMPQADVDGVLATVGLVFVSYAGLTKVASVAEEIQRPERNVLLGMGLSLGVAAAVYVLGTWLLVLVIPPEVLSGNLTPIATAADQVLGGRVGVVLVTVAAVAAFASTANAGIMSASRYLLAMGRDRLVGRSFRKVGRFGTPTLSVLTTGAFVCVALLTLDVISVAKLASAFQLLMFALVNLAVIVMRESRIQTYDPAVRTPLYPWMQLVGVFLCLGLIVELGRTAMLFTLGLVAVCVAWFFVYAQHRVVRQGAILHWFERLGRDRFDALEHEMWSILKESGLREDDPYEDLTTSAPVLDLQGPMLFDQVARLAAQRLAGLLGTEVGATAEAFDREVRAGLVPITEGVAIANVRLDDLATHQLLVVRARDGVTVDMRGHDEHPGPSIVVHALCFLVSPDEDPGQHLRLLAKLASQVEQPGFLDAWHHARGEAELRALLVDDALTRLARRLTAGLRSTRSRSWRPQAAPGRFESVLVVGPQGSGGGSASRIADHLGELHGARVTPAPAGVAWLDVVRLVLTRSHDLVVVEAADRPLGFDPPTMNLLRKCPCPVWVARPTATPAPARVLAAIDVTAVDDAHRSLNTQVLGMAAMMAERTGAEVHVAHAWRVAGADLLREVGMLDDAEAPEDDADWERVYAQQLDALLREHPLDRHRTQVHLVEGEASDVLPEVVQREGIDLIIMGTVCRTGVAGLLIGNTAESVLQRVGCSVLAIKPRGFVTPVQLED